MENRNGLIMVPSVTHASGTAEREAAEEMVEQVAGDRRITLGSVKNYDIHELALALRNMNVMFHVTANTECKGGSAIDGRTTRHSVYDISLKIQKRIEEAFGTMTKIEYGRIVTTKNKSQGRSKSRRQAFFFKLRPFHRPVKITAS